MKKSDVIRLLNTPNCEGELIVSNESFSHNTYRIPFEVRCIDMDKPEKVITSSSRGYESVNIRCEKNGIYFFTIKCDIFLKTVFRYKNITISWAKY